MKRAVVLAGGIALLLPACFAMRPSSGGGQKAQFTPPRRAEPADVAVPAGYRIEVVAEGLTFPTGVAFDDSVVAWVVEAKGQAAFMRHCNQCHTGGETSFAPALNNKPAPGFLIKLQVRQGLGAMPAFPESEISASELDAIVDYLMALRKQPAPPAQVAESRRAP